MWKILSRWQIVPAVALLALAAGPAARRANADEWNKRTILTVNQPIEVADTVLQPGKYVLQLPNGNGNRHVVFVFNGDQSHLIETVITIPTERLDVRGHTQFSFWETPPGTAKALRDWYYPGDNFGQEFPYPKHPQQLAMLEKPVTTSAAPTQPAPPATPAAQPPAEQPAPSTNTSEAAPPPPPPTPPPTEAEQTPAPASGGSDQTPPPAQSTPAPKELPKTASPYPLLGLSGALLLAFAGLLRLKRAGAK